MALDATRLKQSIKTAYTDAQINGGDDRDSQLDYFCEQLANAIVNEVKNLHISYQNGLVVGSTAVTGTINHTVQ